MNLLTRLIVIGGYMKCCRHLSCFVVLSLDATSVAVAAAVATSVVGSASLDSPRRLETTTPYMYVWKKCKALPDRMLSIRVVDRNPTA
jgi:hypothetical protein